MAKVVAAAIIINGKPEWLPPPNRHHNIIWKFPLTEGWKQGEQGFMIEKSDGTLEFVTREEAAKIAIRANQIAKLNWPPLLYSEDLW